MLPAANGLDPHRSAGNPLRMGIYSRDYLREDYSPHGGSWSGQGVLKWLIIVNAVVFVIQVVATRREVQPVPVEWGPDFAGQTQETTVSYLEEWFSLDPQKVRHGQIWRLATYDFLHHRYGIWHLIFNMWMLYMAGQRVADFYGPREFLWFYVTAGFVSGIVFVLWSLYFGNLSPAIGASGAVVAVVILYALNWPDDVWCIFGLIPVKVIWIAIITAAVDLHPMLLELGGEDFNDGIAHSAHVGGMLFALAYQRRNWRLEPLLTRFKKPDLKRALRSKAKLRVYQPEVDPRDFERRVDELLQKVAEQGESSLNDTERELLMEASRRYRNRQR
jgi:membrane associated rhomboid family serine protease